MSEGFASMSEGFRFDERGGRFACYKFALDPRFSLLIRLLLMKGHIMLAGREHDGASDRRAAARVAQPGSTTKEGMDQRSREAYGASP